MDIKPEILPAVEADLADILEIQKEAFMQEADRIGDYDIAPLHQTLDSIGEDFKTHKFFKAQVDGQIAGSVKCSMGGSECWLGRLVVSPRWQGMGIGRLLLSEAEKYFGEADVFVLFTEQDNVRGLALYNSAGYRTTGEIIRDPRSGLELVKLVKYRNGQVG